MVKLSILLVLAAGLLVPTSASAGGGSTELYSWRDKDENWMFVMLPGTNFQKSEKDVKESKLAVMGADALKKKLAVLPKEEQVHWGAHDIPGFEFPEKDVIKDIKKAAKEAKVVLTRDKDDDDKPAAVP